jgi:hypothetical protein
MHYEGESFWHAPETSAERKLRLAVWGAVLLFCAGLWTLAIYGAARLIGG